MVEINPFRIRNPEASKGETFWAEAITILETTDTDVLKKNITNIAECASKINTQDISNTIAFLEKKYANMGTRKFTSEPVINHALRVALLTALFVGKDTVSQETLQVALAHDLFEDTDLDEEGITQQFGKRVANGIITLSHKNHGTPLYVGDGAKTKYFEEIVTANKQDPELRVATIKIVDQLAVANDPLKSDQIKQSTNKTKNEQQKAWGRMTQKKIDEIDIFHDLLVEKAESILAEKVLDIRAFTQWRKGARRISAGAFNNHMNKRGGKRSSLAS